ncbi:MAG: TonB-dependent receptor, partial [Marinirhabdus sp.]
MKLLAPALLLFISTLCHSQQSVIVSGNIVEGETNAPLEYATVSFLTPQKEVVAGGITNLKGEYAIEVPVGAYTVQYDFISYKTVTTTGQRITQKTTLPTVVMQIDVASLDEVVVRAETTEVQIRLDKKVYNIGKDLTTGGATVSDALANVPSVTVDGDGAIALRGNENVRILINGKPSAIAGFGSTDALRQLPAEAIERVEVITSPSARYDAEGTAGILNIILRKEKTLGFNGSVRANLGHPVNTGINLNANLRTDKFNIFNNTGLRYRKRPGNASFTNNYFSGTRDNPLVTETRDYDRLNRGFNTNLGIEYYITETSSVTASGFFRSGDDEDTTENLTDEFDRNNTLAISRVRTELETEKDENYQFSLNYVNDLDKNGHKLTADFQYETGDETKRSLITERNTLPVTDLPAENIIELEKETEYLVQVDYVLPIGENAQFEAGYRGNFEESTNDYTLTEEVGTTGNFVRNDS